MHNIWLLDEQIGSKLSTMLFSSFSLRHCSATTGNPRIDPSIFEGLYHPFLVKSGMVDCWVYLTQISVQPGESDEIALARLWQETHTTPVLDKYIKPKQSNVFGTKNSGHLRIPADASKAFYISTSTSTQTLILACAMHMLWMLAD